MAAAMVRLRVAAVVVDATGLPLWGAIGGIDMPAREKSDMSRHVAILPPGHAQTELSVESAV